MARLIGSRFAPGDIWLDIDGDNWVKNSGLAVSNLSALSEAAGLRLCILNSYHSLSEGIDSDIDCRIEGSALPRQFACLLILSGFKPVQYFQRESSIFVFVVTLGDPSNAEFVWFDVGSDFREIGCIFYKGHRVLASSMPFGDFYIPEPRVEFGHYLIKKIIQNSLNVESANRLTDLFHQDPDGCRQELDLFWGNPWARLIAVGAEHCEWQGIFVNLSRIRTELLRGQILRRPLNLPRYWVPEIIRRVRRWSQPSGLQVVFLGPDGSGKSTIIENVERRMRPAFRGTSVRHLFPGLRKRTIKAGSATDPHGQSSRSLLGSLTKMVVWTLEYSLGYVIRIRPKLVRSNLVLFDRYFPDIIVDPKRYRYGGPAWLTRYLWSYLPKPDLIILLDAPVEVLQQRKQEVPRTETERQRVAYLSLVKAEPNGHVIDASRSIEEVVSNVNGVIIDYLAQRTARRLAILSTDVQA